MLKKRYLKIKKYIVIYILMSDSKYQKGKIYKIFNNIDEEIYVGSTIERLSQRIAKHRCKCEAQPHYKLYQHMATYGKHNFFIELIENYPCENKEELNAREGEWIRKIGTLNQKIAGRNSKGWYEDNREEHNQKTKEYRNNHREEIMQLQKEYRQKHQEQINEYDRDRYKNNPERNEQVKARVKKWREENSEYVKERARKYREGNREKLREKDRLYRQKKKQQKETEETK